MDEGAGRYGRGAARPTTTPALPSRAGKGESSAGANGLLPRGTGRRRSVGRHVLSFPMIMRPSLVHDRCAAVVPGCAQASGSAACPPGQKNSRGCVLPRREAVRLTRVIFFFLVHTPARKHSHAGTHAPMPWESAPPFALIMVMLGGMGGIQAGVHKLFHGKPKAVCTDAWDRATVARDVRATAAAAAAAAGSGSAAVPASKVCVHVESGGRGGRELESSGECAHTRGGRRPLQARLSHHPPVSLTHTPPRMFPTPPRPAVTTARRRRPLRH